VISVTTTELEDMLFCRRTYITFTVATLLINHKHSLSGHFKALVCKEILRAIESGEAGMQMDVDEWSKVVEEYSQ
jgi:hypothetical protein